MIITTMNDSFDTAQSVLEDLQGGVLDISPSREGFGLVESILRSRGQCAASRRVQHSQTPPGSVREQSLNHGNGFSYCFDIPKPRENRT